MESISRRTLLKQGAVLAGAALVAPSALAGRARAASVGYGPLFPTGDGHISLPKGFSYHVVDEKGVDVMADGSLLPGVPDGQAFYPHPTNRKLWRVVRNHELGAGSALGDGTKAYDTAAEGSVIAYDMDPATVMPVPGSHYVIASGMVWPCSGGATPRKTWLTCEEATGLSGPVGLTQKHGYVFEIPSSGPQIKPSPLKDMGRFVHEAAVTDPKTGIVYMTEDDTPAGFYRFVPKDKNRLASGGTLQMLKVGEAGYDTRKQQTVGADLSTTWVTIPTADPDLEGGGPASRVVNQGIGRDGAVFDYLEGEDFKNGAVTFNSAYGGDNNHGQVWRYTPSTGKLRLLYEAKNRDVLDTPDNVAVSPRGGILLCEDGFPVNFMRGLTTGGEVFDFAENLVTGDSEFSGPAYTPDGKWLVVAIQSPGITVAITGPWGRGLL